MLRQRVGLDECDAGSLNQGEVFPTEQWCSQELCSGGGSTNSVEDRGEKERGSGGGSSLVRGSGGSCNYVQEISFI